MEEMEEVLFALSSEDRMKLFSEIKSQDLRLTDLAARLSSSVQETSKHLTRLTDCKLIEKTSGGTYSLTPFGKLTGDILPSISFVSRYRKYFLTHDISFLPKDLLMQIGQLSESRFQDHVTNVLVECQHLLGIAEKYFCWSIDEPLPWFNTKKLPSETFVKILLPASTTAEAVQRAREIVGGRPEFRFAEEVKVGIALNERLAGVVFPDTEGRMDLRSGFIGYDQIFQKWCLALFNSMWQAASPRWPPKLEEELSHR
jgi:hypothetical protein